MACTPCDEARKRKALEHARRSRPGVELPALVTEPLQGFVVIRETEPREVIAWYPDEYVARHEAQLWEQDSKVLHTHEPAALFRNGTATTSAT